MIEEFLQAESISMPGLIAFSIFIVVFVFVLLHNYTLSRKKNRLLALIVQLEVDKRILSKKLEEEMADNNSKKDIEKTEGFLNFISESRDWAFKYIEDVQAALEKFKNKVGPELEYINKYGQLVGISQLPGFKKISEAYEELLKVMPDDSDIKDQPQG
jgi:hypothetical protein